MTKISLASRAVVFLGLATSLGLTATSSVQTKSTVSLVVERTVAFLHNEDVLPSLNFLNAKEISAAANSDASLNATESRQA